MLHPIFTVCFLLFFCFIRSSLAQEINGLIFQNTIPSLVNDSKIELLQYIEAKPPRILLSPGTRVISCAFRNKKCRFPLELLLSERILSLHSDLQLKLQLLVNGKKQSWEIHLVPQDFPFFDIEGRSVLKKPIIFAISPILEACYLFKLSSAGAIEFFRRVTGVCGEFRPHLIEGKEYYSYQSYPEGISRVALNGPRHILDADFNLVKNVPLSLDSHEFLLQGLDHWVSFEIELGRLKNGQTYLNKKIRERLNNEVVFEWGVSDFLEQFNTELVTEALLTSYKNETVLELLHMNSIQRLGDQAYLVSLGQNGIALIEKKSKKIEWILGGPHDQFSLNITQQPIFAHTAWLDQKTSDLYLFANRTYGLTHYYDSKVFRYKLDLQGKKVLEFEVMKDNIGYTDISGSVQVVDGVLNIGLGQKILGKYDFIEVMNGKETFRITFKKRHNIYRYYRRPFGE